MKSFLRKSMNTKRKSTTLSRTVGERAGVIFEELQVVKAKLEKLEEYEEEYGKVKAAVTPRLDALEKELGTDIKGVLREIARDSAKGKDVSEAEDELDELIGTDKSKKKLVREWKDLTDELAVALENKRSADAEKVELRREKVELERQLEPLQLYEGTAWESLSATLPIRQFSTKTPTPNTSTRNTINFPASPLKVFEISHENMLRLFTDMGFVKMLQDVEVTENMEVIFQTYEEEGIAGGAGDEVGVSGFVQTDVRAILAFCTRHNVLTDQPCIFSGKVKTLGDMDFQIGCGKVEDDKGKWVSPKTVLIAGEVKTDKLNESHFAKTYCDYGCTGCSYASSSTKRKNTGGRHNDVSVVRQLYNYALVNGLFYGLFSNHQITAGFIRDCKGNLAITPSLAFDSKTPHSVAQFLVLFYLLAKTQKIPENIEQYLDGKGVLTPCDGSGECKHHHKLPPNCQVATDKGAHKSIRGDAQDTAKHFFVDNVCVSAVDLEFTGDLPSGRTGSTKRLSLKNREVVLKIADIFKHPELEDEITNEAQIYEHLKSLQGNAIPELVNYGRFSEEFLCGLATTDSGIDADSFEPDEAFRLDALEKLRKIHALGVLHGDIKRGNILKDAFGKAKFVDFAFAKMCDIDEDEKKREEEELLNCLT